MPSFGRTLKRVPAARLVAAGELLLLAHEHLAKLEPQERRRILQLVRHGHGRPSHLSERERRELTRLVQKTEPRAFASTAIKRLTGFGLPGGGHDGQGAGSA